MTDSGWRKRQTALDKKAENARELGLDYDIHSCSHLCTRPMCVAEAVQAEREAIDQLVNDDKELSDSDAIRICKAIRARSGEQK
jgi:hypothetical protein